MYSPAAVHIGQRCKGKGKDFFWKGEEKVGIYFLQIAHYRRYQRRVQDFKGEAFFA